MLSSTILNNFRSLKIAVFGDVMLDSYLQGIVTRISPEAPVPILKHTGEEYRLGGAANVSLNLASLGVTPLLCSLVGKDKEGKILADLFDRNNLSLDFIGFSDEISTTNKTRVVSGNHQILRIDNECSPSVFEANLDVILPSIQNLLREVDALIISDYGKGLVNQKTLALLKAIVKKKNIYTVIDPKKVNFPIYYDFDAMTPNHIEASEDIGMPCNTKEEIKKAASLIIEKHNLKHLLLTRGKNGMVLIDREKKITYIPALSQSVYDVSGAGDTVIAAFTASRSAGADFEESAIIANHAASIAVSKFGTATVSLEELRESMYKFDD